MHRPSSLARVHLTLAMLFFSTEAVRAKTVFLDDSDHSTHICMNVGDRITIKLKSNVTTGYSWDTSSVPSCLVRQESKQKQKSSPRIGEPGFQVFSFKATDRCEAVINLHYFRPFEKDQPPAKTFSVDVSVQQRSGSAARTSD